MLVKSVLVLAAVAALPVTPASAQTLSDHLDLFRPKYEHSDVRKQLNGDTPTAGVLDAPEARAAQHRRSMRKLHEWRPHAARQQLLDERCRADRKRCIDL
jgi:hypothetical protein